MPQDLPENLWVVIPAFNEAKRIGRALDEVLAHARNVVVVNDCSKDDTHDVVLKKPVWLISHGLNLGQGAALQTGITFAISQGAQYIATFDSDGQHDPKDLAAMYRVLTGEQLDYVLGSRFLGHASGMPFARRLILKLGVFYTRLLSGVALSDTHNGIRLMTRKGAMNLRITLNRMEHASEILDQIVRSRLRYREIPVNIRYSEETLAKGQKTSNAIRVGIKFLIERLLR